MTKLVADPVFWGALMALVGVIVGTLVGGWGKKKEHNLAALQASVEVLRAEYERLNKEVAELRDSMRHAEKKHRQSMEKYSAALAWIVTVHTVWNGLKVRLDLIGFEYGELPAVPDIIVQDLPVEPIDT